MRENETGPHAVERNITEAGEGQTNKAATAAVAEGKEEARADAALREEARDLRDRLARVSAELDNYRKRQQREKEQAIAFANESLLLALIPVIDSVERALIAEGDPRSVVRGVHLAKKQFEDALARHGAAAFTTVGEPFNPARAEAVELREDPRVPPGTVLDEHQRGWSLHGRLVRPARVVVAAEPIAGDAVH